MLFRSYQALAAAGFDAGIVYSDEHYHGDVPYLGGNTNISVEPVAGIVGKNGFAILAGLEGCYVAEQLSPRSGCRVSRVQMLKLADEENRRQIALACSQSGWSEGAALTLGGQRPRRQKTYDFDDL